MSFKQAENANASPNSGSPPAQQSSGVNGEGNRFNTPGGTNQNRGSSYHYSNKNGSYFYANDNGSSYYRAPSGKGYYRRTENSGWQRK